MTFIAATLLVAAQSAQAQPRCVETDWLPGKPAPGIVNYTVHAVSPWDPDGPGPQSARLAIGGSFEEAGGITCNHIIAWDPATDTWQGMGPGLTGNAIGERVSALASLPNGDLVAGGSFLHAGPVKTLNIARWDGNTWSPLAQGLSNEVSALHVLDNGDLIAGGNFPMAGDTVVNRVARWDGSMWHALGMGVSGGDNHVSAIASLPTGDIFVGGSFTSASGVPVHRLARWDGSDWTDVGGGVTWLSGLDAYVTSLATTPSGTLVVGGNFLFAGTLSAKHLAAWNPTTQSWSTFETGVDSMVHDVRATSNGMVYVCGGFTKVGFGTSASRVAMWDGSQWSALGPGIMQPGAYRLAELPGNSIVVAGDFYQAGNMITTRLAQWNGSHWSAIGGGFTKNVSAFELLPNSDLLAGGQFTTLEGREIRRIARRDRDTGAWSNLGAGIGDWAVYAIKALPNGDIIAGGEFKEAGGVPASAIARWDGQAWLPMGDGMSYTGEQWPTVHALATFPNGDVVAGGRFVTAGSTNAANIARWNGQDWFSLGAGVNNRVYALTTLSTGDLIAGGSFNWAGSGQADKIARWDGQAWHPLGAGLGPSYAAVASLLELPNGDLLAGGDFIESAGKAIYHIARWDGAEWWPIGGESDGAINGMALLSNGDVIAGGDFGEIGGQPACRIARWNGEQWFPLGQGIDHLNRWGPFGSVSAICALGGDAFAVGGQFATAGDYPSAFFAMHGCPAISCQADCDQSSSLTIDDFMCFQTLFAVGDPVADCDASGSLAVDDFICFQTLFAIGC